MDRTERRKIDRQIIDILVPVIVENALMTLAGMILPGFVGRLPVSDISAYGLGNRIFNIYYAIFRGLTIGVMIIAAKAYGRGDLARCRRLQQECYMAIMPLAVLVALLIILIPQSFIGTMTADPGLLATGGRYLRVIAFGFPAIAMTSLNAAAFQAQGNTRMPMITAGLGNLVTIGCGYALVFGLGVLPALGLTGAAVSQLLSQAVMCLFGLWLIYGRHGLYAGIGRGGRLTLPSGADVRQLYATGVPAALENSFWNLATVIISRVILSYGQAYYAAYQLGLQAEGLCDMVSTGFVTAAMTLAAIAIGRGDEYLYRRYFKRLMFQCLVITAAAMAVLAFGSSVLCGMLTDKPQLIAIALTYLHAMVWSQLPQNASKIYAGFIRSCHHEKMPMVINFVGVWLVRLPLVLVCGGWLKLDVVWLWWTFNLDQWCRLLIAAVFFKRHRVIDYLSDRSADGRKAARTTA